MSLTNYRIKLPAQSFFAEKGVMLPQFIWREPPFRFTPVSFVPSSEELTQKIYEASHMEQAYLTWKNRSSHPLLANGVYGLSSEPSDGKALYFAAHLIHLWLEKKRAPRPINVSWLAFGSESDFTIGDPILQQSAPTDLLVISNLSPNSSRLRLERTRDLIFHRSFPVLVVVAGEVPMSFFARRLFAPLQACFFASSKLVNRKIEVLA